MPLRSRHFRDSKRLQACLVSDPAHVTPGQTGDHVSRIQYALMRLQVDELPDSETDPQRYGPRTAAAVLTYKRSLEIINRRYQREADNIVGRMTIKSLDDYMWVLEGGGGPERLSRFSPFHPASPPQPRSIPILAGAALGFAPDKPKTFAVGDAGDAFEPPLSDLPPDLQEAVRRSNAAKKPGVLTLFPFLAGHEGPQSGKELSKRFADHPSARNILLALHGRMKPFGIFAHVKEFRNIFSGVGSKGFFCEPFDHDKFLTLMASLTVGRNPGDRLRDAAFCRDKFNVHGPRDSFREIVKSGEGLHICITQPANRNDTPCDLHIDETQQGQVCFDGFCVPLINRQTGEHVRQVGPWLVKDTKDKVVDWTKKKTGGLFP